MRFLITGSSGFIGSALMSYLLRKGYKVRGIDICEPFYEEHQPHWIRADILDKSQLEQSVIPFEPTHLVHLAARTDLGLNDDLQGFRENTDGVRNVLETCKMIPALRMASFASTILVCKVGDVPRTDEDYSPTTPYGESKMIGEKIVRESAESLKFSFCIIRPTSIWGYGYGSHYLDFFRAIAKSWYFHPGSVNNQAVYGYIGNCIYQIEKIMTANSEKVNQKVFYLGDYSPIELKDWVEMIHYELGKKKVKVMPNFIVRPVARFGDMLWRFGWKTVPLTSFRLGNMSTDQLYDTSLTQSVVGPLPYTLKDGVKETLTWLKERKEI